MTPALGQHGLGDIAAGCVAALFYTNSAAFPARCACRNSLVLLLLLLLLSLLLLLLLLPPPPLLSSPSRDWCGAATTAMRGHVTAFQIPTPHMRCDGRPNDRARFAVAQIAEQ